MQIYLQFLFRARNFSCEIFSIFICIYQKFSVILQRKIKSTQLCQAQTFKK